MFSSLLSLVPAGLMVEQILPAPDRITLMARGTDPAPACPLCHQPSARYHSQYTRQLADLPWQGRVVEIHIHARRLRCGNTVSMR